MRFDNNHNRLLFKALFYFGAGLFDKLLRDIAIRGLSDELNFSYSIVVFV
jgi:hypothetical protein